MSSTPADRKSAIARFAVFEADFKTRELRKNGSLLRLQEQPFAVLSVLLDRAGSIVTREELHSRLWPADTFVDFDHGLNTAVNKLREALGDSAANPRFIETVARRGYRFLAEVRWQTQEEGLPATVAQAKNAASSVQLSDLPKPHRGFTRVLFGLLQLMYLIFYLEALIHWQGIDQAAWLGSHRFLVQCVVMVSAACGIPVRLYLLSAVSFDYSRLGKNFLRIFPAVFFLDELWALAPFLIVDRLTLGGTLAAVATLLYAPFAERTLVRMAYPLEMDIK